MIDITRLTDSEKEAFLLLKLKGENISDECVVFGGDQDGGDHEVICYFEYDLGTDKFITMDLPDFSGIYYNYDDIEDMIRDHISDMIIDLVRS